MAPDATGYDALKLMADWNVGAVLVMDANHLVGILSERDYARKVILHGKSSKDTSVWEIMTQRVVYVRPEQTAEECMALITDKRVRHLPVLEDDQVIGVISIGDVARASFLNRGSSSSSSNAMSRGPYIGDGNLADQMGG